jgi:hypothetical protein
MDDRRSARLVARALRCYPARWRRRHGDEAAELAALLIRDGASAGSVALSYLLGAGREWLTPPPGQRLSAAACALLIAVSSVSVSAVLLAAPARAALTPAPGGGAGASRTHSPQLPLQPRHQRQPQPCRPGSAGSVPGVIRALGQLPTIIWEAGNARSC